MAALLLVGAEREERRTEHVEPDDGDELGRARGGELAIDDDLLGGRSSATSELGRPGASDISGLVELPLPLAQRGDPRGRARAAARPGRGSVRRERHAPRREAAAPPGRGRASSERAREREGSIALPTRR